MTSVADIVRRRLGLRRPPDGDDLRGLDLSPTVRCSSCWSEVPTLSAWVADDGGTFCPECATDRREEGL